MRIPRRAIFVLLIGLLAVWNWYASQLARDFRDGRLPARPDYCELGAGPCATELASRYAFLPLESKSLEMMDGKMLVVDYIPSVTGIRVLLLHDYRGNRQSVYPLLNALWKMGVGVLVPDLRGHGESEGDYLHFGEKALDDVSTLFEALKEGAQSSQAKYFIAGTGFGAALAVEYTRKQEEVNGIVVSEAFYPGDAGMLSNKMDLDILTALLMRFHLQRFEQGSPLLQNPGADSSPDISVLQLNSPGLFYNLDEKSLLALKEFLQKE